MLRQPTYTPFLTFTRKQWKQYGTSTAIPLTEEEIKASCGFNESISVDEAADIYLPLCRLLSIYVTQRQSLHSITNQFLHQTTNKVPFVIGVSGSVAVGKSTTSRLLQRILSHWENHNKVDIVTTDGFLYPNAVLNERKIMHRKGFPESFQLNLLIDFLTRVKSGERQLSVPTYSHAIYDITGNMQIVDQPDILIIEGLNLLQPANTDKPEHVVVSDFIDFSIYVDAPQDIIGLWYLERFLAFRKQAEHNPDLFFHQFAGMTDEDARAYAKKVWTTVNEPNLIDNILPTKHRAHLILEKQADHSIGKVSLRKV